MSAVDGDVDVSVNGGRGDIAFDTAPHHVRADSNGGSTNIGIRSDPKSERTIEVQTNGGNIDVLYAATGHR